MADSVVVVAPPGSEATYHAPETGFRAECRRTHSGYRIDRAIAKMRGYGPCERCFPEGCDA